MNKSSVQLLNNDAFDSKFNLASPLNQAPAIILFYRDGCPHCVEFKPTFAKAAMQDGSGVQYFAVNTAENPALMQRLDQSQAPFTIDYVPKVFGFSQGQFVGEFNDDRTIQNLHQFGKLLGGTKKASNVMMLNSSHFDKNFQLKTPLDKYNIVILFYRDGCPHCVHLKPVYKQAADEQNQNVIYAAIDTASEDSKDLMNHLSYQNNAPFEITGVPTIVAYHKGKFYSKFGGNRTKSNIQQYAATIGKAPISYVKQY
jgi:thioredoxin-like negative regulator of GroEL